MRRITIAIDGPAASGKSTVAQILAAERDYVYFDTGVMYRAVTWAALERGIAIEDEMAIADLALRLRIDVLAPTLDDGRQYTVLADGEDITWAIRSEAVDRNVSPVSAYRGVRQALTIQQRRIGSAGGVVMVGRDIGTVVLPEAEVKIYLDASVEERANRRHKEILGRGQASEYERVLADLKRRDAIDSSRQEAPLCVAEGATVIDSSDMGIDEVAAEIRRIVKQRLSPNCEEC